MTNKIQEFWRNLSELADIWERENRNFPSIEIRLKFPE